MIVWRCKKQFLTLPVLGTIDQVSTIAHDAVIVAIGDNRTRQRLFETLYQQNASWWRAASAIVAPDVEIGPGSMICAGAIINPGSTVGTNVILNTACTADHHNHIAAHAHIAPGVHLGGEVTVGSGALIGIGATVMPGCHIGALSVIGAGAVVIHDIPDGTTAVGVPARALATPLSTTASSPLPVGNRDLWGMPPCQCNLPMQKVESMKELLPIIRPTLPPLREVAALLESSWESGIVTVGATVRAFEAVCNLTGARHAIAVSSCTAGLMLVPRALHLPAGSEVIIPSFTFAATAQALVWNGLVPVFCDCLPRTCTLDPEDVERNVSPRTVAICPVYSFGLAPDMGPPWRSANGGAFQCILIVPRA